VGELTKLHELIAELSEPQKLEKFYSKKYNLELIPLKPGQLPPKGAQVFTGRRGGKYYYFPRGKKKEEEETVSQPQIEEKPVETDPIKKYTDGSKEAHERLFKEHSYDLTGLVKDTKYDRIEWEAIREYAQTHKDNGTDKFLKEAIEHARYKRFLVWSAEYDKNVELAVEYIKKAREKHPEISHPHERGIKDSAIKNDDGEWWLYNPLENVFAGRGDYTSLTKDDWVHTGLNDHSRKLHIDVENHTITDSKDSKVYKFKDLEDLQEILIGSFGFSYDDKDSIKRSYNFFSEIGTDKGDPLEKFSEEETTEFKRLISRFAHDDYDAYHIETRTQDEIYRFCQYLASVDKIDMFTSAPSYLDEEHASKLIDWTVGQVKRAQSLGIAHPCQADLLGILMDSGATGDVCAKALAESYKLYSHSHGARLPMPPVIEDQQNLDVAKHQVIDNFLIAGGTRAHQALSSAVNKIFNGKTDRTVFYWRDSETRHAEPIPPLITSPDNQILAVTKDIYRETQEYFRNKKIDTVTVYRGVNSGITTNSPIESWTASLDCARRFNGGSGAIFKVTVPIDRIFMSYKSQRYDWLPEEDLEGKKEYTLIGIKDGKSLFDEFQVEKV